MKTVFTTACQTLDAAPCAAAALGSPSTGSTLLQAISTAALPLAKRLDS
jgi:hypothetical protein